MGLTIYQVDAFTDQPFGGNPAAVCLLPAPRGEDWMQMVAREMNLSETAFLHRENDGWRLRWFTSAVEVALCGHATLASAHVLWETGRVPVDRPIGFVTLSGVLTASRRGARRGPGDRHRAGGPERVRLAGGGGVRGRAARAAPGHRRAGPAAGA